MSFRAIAAGGKNRLFPGVTRQFLPSEGPPERFH
jgi:hypothetical protein